MPNICVHAPMASHMTEFWEVSLCNIATKGSITIFKRIYSLCSVQSYTSEPLSMFEKRNVNKDKENLTKRGKAPEILCCKI